ncbi:type I-E CRISPR-associated protein Cse1/CasA [Nitrosomonas europaea]|uniref:type I-E CRISPR-associated protein Cse1/CasA n=1 Tax=Nitrosomonas europaea TaxID=915 RepID=UPI000793F297|nr:type I-E CRISPR-associated protein Cse1/CasA [Nitrosomonas europaea]KXK45622.1 MAG: CRISPR-associated protein CasA/Cse1 [Nitrosomonas europaea]HRN82719.1 type I-E CRISPR-associated protein Cse1/CasA [Nitrosomonas europaea]HRO55258.1 type I-E CRISPR-associated protein Cse1/CasA [Nitrosomonas europaea]HUM73032.1 type I-E CRISPR-associated protein Cse1/CasA [Nitrosomonas europaea]
MENRFNLIDEPWIPVADIGRVSLRQIFSQPEYRALGGNPVQKIALMKLLLAIAQAACTPVDEVEWKALGARGLAESCLAYLEHWHDRFYLYGEQPFLQMLSVQGVIAERTRKRVSQAKTKGAEAEALASGEPKKFGAGFYPDLPSENNTMLSHALFPRELEDADRAVFLISVMNFSFGGKRVESDLISLAGAALGSRHSSAAGPSLGGWDGQLHCFPMTESIMGSVWINLLTKRDIEKYKVWPGGLGVPLWEAMPETEICPIAEEYKTTYQATLLALSRFVLLQKTGVYYLDGIRYAGVKNGWVESGLLIDKSKGDIKVKYADPEKRPWRELQALLACNFFSTNPGFECIALKVGIERLVDNFEIFSIWCAGLKVTANSGDQSVKQGDDFIESQVWLHRGILGDIEFSQLKAEMDGLDEIAKNLYGQVAGYFKEQKVQLVDGSKLAAQSTNLFWQLCERDFQALVNSCDQDKVSVARRHQLQQRFARYAQQAYDRFCPKETARQLDAWAKCRPNHSKYLKQEA